MYVFFWNDPFNRMQKHVNISKAVLEAFSKRLYMISNHNSVLVHVIVLCYVLKINWYENKTQHCKFTMYTRDVLVCFSLRKLYVFLWNDISTAALRGLLKRNYLFDVCWSMLIFQQQYLGVFSKEKIH